MSADSEPTQLKPSLAAPAHAADALTLGLLAVAVWWWLVARPVTWFNGLRDVLSPWILIYVAASVQIVRHLTWPRPSALSRLRDLRTAIVERPHLADALRAFFLTRPAVFIVALAAVITLGITSTPGFVLSREPLDNLPARFDAGWYGGIALDGYTWDHTFQRQRNIAFFPALPLLMRPVGAALGMYEDGPSRERRMLRGLWAGAVISLAAFFWALYYLSRLASDLIGPDRASAATLLLAAYPFAVYFNAPYTESLFLLGSAAASYHFLRRDWIAASAWGLFAGLSRPNGCFLAVALAVLAFEREKGKGKREAPSAVRNADRPFEVFVQLAVAAMPAIGMLLFTLYLYQLTGGVWFAWARSHEAWGRSFEGLAPIVSFFEALRDESWLQLIVNNPYNAINATGVIFALVMTYPVFRKLGLAWGVFVLINLLPPLAAGGLLSTGRLTSTLFPLFLAFAAILPARAVPGWVAAFGIGQGFCAALFFTWRALF
jgi:mannosyltransferase PIG-V